MKTYEFNLLLQFDEDFEELEPDAPELDTYDLIENIHQALLNQAEGAGLAIKGFTVGAELRAKTGEYGLLIIAPSQFQVILGAENSETNKTQNQDRSH